jgi:exonuclease SbcC
LPFIIRRVELQGFLGHREKTRLDLEEGAYALVGENGAGKSSVVDAIRAALTLPDALKVRSGEVVNNSSSKAWIRVELEDPRDGRRLIVEAEKERGKSPRVTAQLIDEKLGLKKRAVGLREARRLVAEALGVPPDGLRILESTVIIRQGGLASIAGSLASTSPKSRREFFEEILGVKDYRKALDTLRNMPLDSEAPGINVSERAPSNVERLLEKARRELEEARREVRRDEEELEKVEGELASIEERLKELEGAVEEYGRLRASLESIDNELKELEERLRERLEEKRRLEEESRRLEKLEEELRRLEKLAGLADKLRELEGLEAEEEKLKSLWEELRGRLDAARRALELADAARSYGEIRERLDSTRKALRDTSTELARARERLERLVERLERAERSASKLSPLLGVKAPPAEMAEAARRRLEEIEASLEEAERRARDLSEKASAAQARARDLMERAEKLSEATEGRCPLCGAELPPEKARSIASRYMSEAEGFQREAKRLALEARRAEEEARRLERARRAISQALAVLEEALRDLPDAGEVEEARARVERLEAEEERLRREEERLEEELRKLEEAWAEYERLLGRAGIDPSNPRELESLEKELAEAEARLREADAERRRLERILLESTGTASLADARGLVRGALEKLRGVAEEYRRASSARARLEAVEREVESLEARLRELERRARGYRERLGELEELVSEAEELRRRREDLLQERGILQGRIERLRERLGELEAEVERLERLSWKASKARRLLEILKEAPPRVLQAELALLSRYMSEALSSFGLDVVSASFKADRDTVELVLTRANGARAYMGELSGGERVAVALSFIIALSRLHSLKTGFLILDEPTAELDRDRRASLVSILRRASEGGLGIPQLIVVTHDEDVAAAASEVCRVERRGGTSRVECGGG